MRRLLLLALLVAGCGGSPQATAPAEAPPVAVSQAVVQAGTLPEYLELTGHLRSLDRAEISSKISGRVDAVRVREGDRVTAGMPLVVLDSRDLNAQVVQASAQIEVASASLKESQTSVGLTTADVSTALRNAQQGVIQAEAEEAKARADLADARLNLEREKSLFKQDAVPKIQVEQAELRAKLAERTVESARASVKVARQQVELARANQSRQQLSLDQVGGARAGVTAAQAGLNTALVMQEYAVLSSPIDGYVIRRAVEPGQIVGPGDPPMLTIVDNSRLELVASAPETFAAFFKPGMAAEVTTDLYPERKFSGRIRQLVPAADPSTHAVKLRLEVSDRGRLFDGTYVKARLKVRDHVGVLVPRLAVQRRKDEVYVLLVEGDKAKKQPVKVAFEGPTQAIVTEGLKSGTAVVTAGSEGLADGQKIKVEKS